MLTESEAERRKPVWTAFSEFWLDAELDDQDLRRIAGAAAASGYTVGQLRDIYLYEVAPVVYLNTCVVAGEWQGFDESWLHAEARRRAERRNLWLRFWVFLGVGCWPMTYAAECHWRRVVELLPAASDGGTPPGSRCPSAGP